MATKWQAVASSGSFASSVGSSVSLKQLFDESPWLQFTSECQRFDSHRASISSRFGQVDGGGRWRALSITHAPGATVCTCERFPGLVEVEPSLPPSGDLTHSVSSRRNGNLRALLAAPTTPLSQRGSTAAGAHYQRLEQHRFDSSKRVPVIVRLCVARHHAPVGSEFEWRGCALLTPPQGRQCSR
eukprot:COSAG01_NODE_3064_length_6647_cov_29.485186_3_plen_185_part_00